MQSESLKAALDNAQMVIPEIPTEGIFDAVTRLSALPALEYEKIREAEAERLGVRVSALDKEVQSARKAQQAQGSGSVLFPVVTAWHEAVDGDVLLHDVVAAIRRFIVCDKETAISTALW